MIACWMGTQFGCSDVEVGLLNKRVKLYRAPDEGVPVGDPLSPRDVWAQIDNQGSGGERVTTHAVTIRHHPEVTIDTVVVYGTRYLFVRSVQNVNEDDIEMRLLCEEIAR